MWAGDSALKITFPRLFCLCLEREVSVTEMGEWVNGVWAWRWNWRRELFDREKSALNNLVDVINRYPLQEHSKDGWRWRQNRDVNFTIKKVYCLLRARWAKTLRVKAYHACS